MKEKINFQVLISCPKEWGKLNIVFVLYLQELIHASVFYMPKKQKPKIGMRDFIIFAAASNYLIRAIMLINALSPFVIISVIGIILIMIPPNSLFPWIFIPTVINAASAGSDLWVYFGG